MQMFLRKRYSENMQCNFIEITLRHGCFHGKFAAHSQYSFSLKHRLPGFILKHVNLSIYLSIYLSIFIDIIRVLSDYRNHCIKMRFSIKDFFIKCYQICRKLRIWSQLLKKFLMENFNFCAVNE